MSDQGTTPGPDAAKLEPPIVFSPPAPAQRVATPLPRLRDASEQIARAIQLFVCGVLVVVWSVVGFAFWIPFLVRAIGIYTAAVLGNTFTGVPLFGAQRGLDTAVRFWFAGFQVALESRHAVDSPRRFEPIADEPPIKNLFEQLFHHLLFTLLFWLSAVLLWVAVLRGWV